MKKIFFLIIAILISLITSQKDKEEPTDRKVPKMVCKYKNSHSQHTFGIPEIHVVIEDQNVV